MRTAVVLLGGLGTRLYPLTEDIPKPALPFLDKPIISYPLVLFKEAGVERIVLCLGYGSEAMLDLFEQNDGFGMEIVPVFEDEPLGTGGALASAIDEFAGEPEILVANGDILCNIDIGAMIAGHRRAGAALTIALYRVDDPSRYGLVRTDEDGRVTAFLEKTEFPGDPPYLINTGAYILTPSLLGALPRNAKISLERELIPAWIRDGVVIGSHVHGGYWRDIGTLASYYRAHFEVLHHYQMYDPAFGGWDDKGFKIFKGYIYIENSVKFAGKVQLEKQVVLMRGVEVGDGARLDRVIALPGARIGAGAVVTDSILGADVEIEPGAKVDGLCITRTKSVPLDLDDA
jgi:mannose-1-phosphate guanylyltransferase